MEQKLKIAFCALYAANIILMIAMLILCNINSKLHKYIEQREKELCKFRNGTHFSEFQNQIKYYQAMEKWYQNRIQDLELELNPDNQEHCESDRGKTCTQCRKEYWLAPLDEV